MTRTERAAEKVRKEKEKAAELERLLKERLAAQQGETRKAEAVLRDALRKADNKRRYYVGALAQEAGLFAWRNAELKTVFAALAELGTSQQVGEVLEALWGGNGMGNPAVQEARCQQVFADMPEEVS